MVLSLLWLVLRALLPAPRRRPSQQRQDDVIDDVPGEYAERYRAWRERFCEFDDGGVSARLVERLF